VYDKPDTPHLLVALIKNIAPSPQKNNKSVEIRSSLQTLRADKKSLKRYQGSKRKDIKHQQKEILDALHQRNTQKKSIRYNEKLSEDFRIKKSNVGLHSLPFASAEQIIANLDIPQTT